MFTLPAGHTGSPCTPIHSDLRSWSADDREVIVGVGGVVVVVGAAVHGGSGRHSGSGSAHRPSSPSGYFDAAWWSRSSNLATELRELICELRQPAGPIGRVVYDPGTWSPADRHLIIDRTTRLDPYPFALFGTMYLCGTDGTVIVRRTNSGHEPRTLITGRVLGARAAAARGSGPVRSWPGR
ncbi:DUF5994 family protein [Nocardia sp. NPDC050799]|uniref:DUF5994 family protein n=1 Tax=Nocardia sp. NPDC050799 TaxID=3154842 RepID=UPI0033E69335